METKRELLFSVSIKDCEVQTFRAGGKGGQNQNKVSSGVRVIHHPSGARGEARDSRDQLRNKRSAFLRMLETAAFKGWHKLEVARRLGFLTAAEAEVDATLHNVRIEVKQDGRWVPCATL